MKSYCRPVELYGILQVTARRSRLQPTYFILGGSGCRGTLVSPFKTRRSEKSYVAHHIKGDRSTQSLAMWYCMVFGVVWWQFAFSLLGAGSTYSSNARQFLSLVSCFLPVEPAELKSSGNENPDNFKAWAASSIKSRNGRAHNTESCG